MGEIYKNSKDMFIKQLLNTAEPDKCEKVFSGNRL
jgi:hypothetical protein